MKGLQQERLQPGPTDATVAEHEPSARALYISLTYESERNVVCIDGAWYTSANRWYINTSLDGQRCNSHGS